ncbi:DNA helicase [Nitzschia inconspicua]|uniref:DNA helicase n=1 Tax=Nitzschia inconspicua TaxID=303405 RepID=A0A9K3LMU8_9STRA|nr:DNA helicase [Nitzschia inconspicua]
MSDSRSSHFVKDRDGNSKFIGGAAMQRRNALKKTLRSKHATRILRPDQVLKSKEILSPKLSPFERYFAGLLRSDASDYAQRNKDHEVWSAICQRLGLPVPNSPLQPYYHTANAHFANRAALVMEESRYAIADGLRRLQRNYRDNPNPSRNHSNNINNNNKNQHDRTQPSANLGPETGEHHRDQSMVSMELLLKAVEHQEKTGHTVLTFAKEHEPFTRSEKQSLRNGTVFACLERKLPPSSVHHTLLAAVLPQSRDEIEQTNSFTVMVFKMVTKTVNQKWNVTSITSLLSEQRKYDACMEQIQRPVPFLLALLGGKRSTHTRFRDEEDDDHVQHDHPKYKKQTTVKKDSDNNKDESSSDEESSSSNNSSSDVDSSSSSESSIEVIEILDSDSVIEVSETINGNPPVSNSPTLSHQNELHQANAPTSDVEIIERQDELQEASKEPNNHAQVIKNNASTSNELGSETVDPNNDSYPIENVTSNSEEERADTAADLSDDAGMLEHVVSSCGDDVAMESSDVNAEGNEEPDPVSSEDEVEVLEIIDVDSTFHMPRLNQSQQAAANAFLHSNPREITLIQGPPGTGKTTLLTSVIGQYVLETRQLQQGKRQLMVCAPTNKAVGVVCSRFLDTFIDEDSFPCNVILIGDDDKLFDDDFHRSGSKGSFSKLRSIFLYTYIECITNDYVYISRAIAKNTNLNAAIVSKIKKVALRLSKRISQNFSDTEVISLSGKILRLVNEICVSNDHRIPSGLEDALSLICKAIDEWNRESIWQELLKSADVIFGTLASTGAAFLRKSIGQVEDLVVDEAAAATEPEIYIPFVYSPKRLLAVGDPKQLPATLASQVAENLGLDKSLHERLMFDCGFDHVMLDTQYRSKPSIMQFPALQFYDDKLRNGGNVIQAGYTNGLTMIDAHPYIMLQVNGVEKQVRSGSYQNFDEAVAIVGIIEKFRPSAVKKYGRAWCTSDRLRVITFYQAQVALISQLLMKKGLGNVLVATVDSSQGCEADHVIVSFVRSDGDSGRYSVGFLTDERRLNVGLTRAKYQLLCVGNIRRLSTLPEGKADVVRRLAVDAFQRDCVIQLNPGQQHTKIPPGCRKRSTRADGNHNRRQKRRQNYPNSASSTDAFL